MRAKWRKKTRGKIKRELKGIESAGDKETIKSQKRERYAEGLRHIRET